MDCRQDCLLCPWARHLTGRLRPMWQTGGLPILHRANIMKLLTKHVVKGNTWVPTNGSLPCWWWGYQLLMTGSKWAAIFPLA